jgi:aspartate racemase
MMTSFTGNGEPDRIRLMVCTFPVGRKANGYFLIEKKCIMKTIGLIGGLTWVSSLDYYRLFNELANERQGGDEVAEIVMYSVNFGRIKELTMRQDWKGISQMLCDAAKKLEAAGATCVLIGANTMHFAAADVQAAVNIPLIHLVKAVGKSITALELKKVLLLGTRYTMQLDFYRKLLAADGIEAIVPGEADIEMVNRAIYDELSRNIFLPATKEKFIRLINKMEGHGAQGVILGCTEIPMLVKPGDVSIPVFDTTKIHVNAALDFALG